MTAPEQALRNAFDEFTVDLKATVTTASFIRWLRENKSELIEGLDEETLIQTADSMVGMTRFHHEAR